MSKQCQDCVFWDRLHPTRQPWSNNDTDPSQIIMGECKRHAPAPAPELFLAAAKWGHMWAGAQEEFDIHDDPPLKDMATVWPITDRVDWCGDFQAKQDGSLTEGEDFEAANIPKMKTVDIIASMTRFAVDPKKWAESQAKPTAIEGHGDDIDTHDEATRSAIRLYLAKGE